MPEVLSDEDAETICDIGGVDVWKKDGDGKKMYYRVVIENRWVIEK